ncbi:hypothetical protein [Nocardioides sp.]|uniref:hypothetical protein n=1 Tax=Nocardioides sp. TaxID=35761 RepID=UPI002720C3C6|nr:hypothetical protein [Nocardioides sp.]MDO9457288.1 hypothetical protein [Nocardioides sp.]
MSENPDQSDTEADLGPKPDAEIEPGEPNPGGVDAVPQADGVDGEDAEPDPLTRDLNPDDNPVTGEIPLEVKQGEDTSTKATKESGDEAADDSEDGASTEESPA